MSKEAGAGFALPPISDSQLDVASLYDSTSAAQLRALAATLKARLERIVQEFYFHFDQFESANALIRCLSESQRTYLRKQIGRYILFIGSGRLSWKTHRAVSVKVGRLHTTLGLRRRDLALGVNILHATISRHVDESSHYRALFILSKRMICDLTWQIDAARIVQESYRRALSELTELVWRAKGRADLLASAAALLGGVDGVAGCAFGRPDGEGLFRFESVSGDRLRRYLADIQACPSSAIMQSSLPQGQGPTGRAWNNGRIERCANFETDEQMLPWKQAGLRHGIRSCVAIPICPPDRTPTTLLTLYSECPGGFTSPDQVDFITQIQTLLVFAIARQESGFGLQRNLPWSTRRRWADLIGSSALEMHYQPILSLHSGRACRVEALVRLWDGGKTLTPAMFFSALSCEDFLAMYERGLEQVLAQQNRWLEQGLDLQVSVNLPVQAVADPRYFNATQRLLDQYGPRPHRLALEVLETGEIAFDDEAAANLEKFRSLQITLAEDDFGTGYSSLARLRVLPFDIVKIDRSILVGLDHSPLDALGTIYQITELCHALGKKVVVEGVESEELIDAISLLGADAVQGYAVARPMRATEISDWMAENRTRPANVPQPSAVLPKLAQLLLWESYLRLLTNKARSRLRRLSSTGKSTLPFRFVTPALQRALLNAAARHGIHGPEYAQARRQLVAAIGGPA